MPATFIIQQKGCFFSFTFTPEDESPLLFSRGYLKKSLCEKAIRDLIQVVNSSSLIIKEEARDGQYSFVVRDKKGAILAHSRIFFAKSSRDFAMRQLVQQGTRAVIKECPVTSV